MSFSEHDFSQTQHSSEKIRKGAEPSNNIIYTQQDYLNSQFPLPKLQYSKTTGYVERNAESAKSEDFQLFDRNGNGVGRIVPKLELNGCQRTPIDSPETEIFKRVEESLLKRELDLDSAYLLFDQNGNNIISPHEIRSTIINILNIPLTDYEIQVLTNECDLAEGGITKNIFKTLFPRLLTFRISAENQE